MPGFPPVPATKLPLGLSPWRLGCVLLAIPIVLIGLHAAWTILQTREMGLSAAELEAAAGAQHARVLFLGVDNIIESAAEPIEGGGDASAFKARAAALLRGATRAVQGVAAISLRDPQGRRVVAAGLPFAAAERPNDPRVTDYARTVSYLAPSGDGPSRGRLIVARAVSDETGALRGVIEVEIVLDSFRRAYDALAGSADRHILFALDDGTIVAASTGADGPAGAIAGRKLTSTLISDAHLSAGFRGEGMLVPNGPTGFIATVRAGDLPCYAIGFVHSGPLWRAAYTMESSIATLLFLIAGMLYFILRRLSNEIASRAVEASNLIESAAAMTEGIAAFDARGRLERFNPAFAAMLPGLKGRIRPGLTFRELLELAQEEAQIDLTHAPAPAVWLLQMRGDFTRGVLDRDIKTADGRTYRVTQRKLPSGRSIVSAIDLTESARREAELRDVNRRMRPLRVAIESVRTGLLITNPNLPGNPIIYANTAFLLLTGYTLSEVSGRSAQFLRGPETSPDAERALRSGFDERKPATVEAVLYRKGGTKFWAEVTLAPVFNDTGAAELFVATIQDVTERRLRAEDHLQQQKLEALGQLASGVAHDFNNLLSIISGYARLSQAAAARGEPVNQQLDMVLEASSRGAHLTQELLAFGRRRVAETTVFDLNALVSRQKNLLRPLLGEAYALSIVTPETPLPVRAHAALMAQALMNLAINARDAMPGGGEVTVTLGVCGADELPHSVAPEARSAATYAVLTVQDTGAGMDPHTAAHAFEPFFTTKDQGKGTGLGLPMVYGAVRDAGGFITIDTAPGKGTRVIIYLPLVEAPPEKRAIPAQDSSGIRFDGKTAMLVEDEPALLNLVAVMLDTIGFKVLRALNGNDALALLDDHDGPVDLILTDVVMPQMSGGRFAELAQALHPEARVLFMSGHLVRAGGTYDLPSDATILRKPFEAEELTDTIARVLDPRAEAA